MYGEMYIISIPTSNVSINISKNELDKEHGTVLGSVLHSSTMFRHLKKTVTTVYSLSDVVK